MRSKRHFGAAQQALAAKPCQLVIGSQDQFTSASSIKKWVDSFKVATVGEGSDRVESQSLQLRVVESASHFWESREACQQLTEAIGSFIIGLGSAPAHEVPPEW